MGLPVKLGALAPATTLSSTFSSDATTTHGPPSPPRHTVAFTPASRIGRLSVVRCGTVNLSSTRSLTRAALRSFTG